MAQPEGTQAETPATGDSAALDAVSDGMSYEERNAYAFRALEAGHEPREVNQAYNAPFKKDEDEGNKAGEDGETAQGDPEEATEGEQTPSDKDDDKGDSPAELPDIEEEKLEKFLAAKRVLQRDQLTDADIERLGIDRAIELADTRSKSQAEIDRRFSQPKPKDEQGNEDTSQQHEAESESYEDYIAEVREYDPELADKLEAKLQGSEKQAESAQAELAKQRLKVKVDQVQSRYPELKDQGVFDQVLDKARQLAQSPVYNDAGDAFEDAATLLLSPRREQRAQDKLLEDNRRQRNGQIDTDTIVDNDTKPMDQDQRESYAMKLLKSGKDPKEVRSILSKVPRPEE